MGLYDPEADLMDEEANYRKAVRLQAQLPTVVTAFSRIRNGLDPVEPNEDYSIAANFLYTLTGEEPTESQVEAIDKALVLHADHELNASTFTARVCVATSIRCLFRNYSRNWSVKGSLHGGANEAVMKMLSDIGNS